MWCVVCDLVFILKLNWLYFTMTHQGHWPAAGRPSAGGISHTPARAARAARAGLSGWATPASPRLYWGTAEREAATAPPPPGSPSLLWPGADRDLRTYWRSSSAFHRNNSEINKYPTTTERFSQPAKTHELEVRFRNRSVRKHWPPGFSFRKHVILLIILIQL